MAQILSPEVLKGYAPILSFLPDPDPNSLLQGTPIIYASIAYRLGAFGFPLRGVEVAKKGALNLGHKDQIAALEWIQANIESFGGDRSKVCTPASRIAIDRYLVLCRSRSLVRALVRSPLETFISTLNSRTLARAAVSNCSCLNISKSQTFLSLIL